MAANTNIFGICVCPVGVVLLGSIMLMSTPSHADEGEYSLYAYPSFGLAKFAHASDDVRRLRSKVLELGFGGTYATHDWFAYEARLSIAFLESQFYNDKELGFSILRPPKRVGADIGVRGRFGVVWIPTVYAGVGVHGYLSPVGQWQLGGFRTDSLLVITAAVVGEVGLGFDHRIDAHWVVGGGVTFEWSLLAPSEYRSTMGFVHIAYYTYNLF